MSVERSASSVEGSAAAAAVDRENPWPGLASFTEDARGFFFGREKETDELSRLVRRQTLTVLFGQSGLGKSSLLQAGLFPILREGDHLPLYLRLDHAPPSSTALSHRSLGEGGSLVDQVKAALTAAFAVEKADAPAFSAGETLWEYFHRKDVDIWSGKNRLLTPVLAFDQFEEIFTLGRADEACSARSRAFLAELACLVENRPPAAVQAKLDSGELDPARFNFAKPSCSVILSLREDFLPDLEGLRREMPALVHNRLRLKKLSGTQALDIVQKPAPHLLAPGVAEKIVEFVAGARGGSAERLAELDVEPPLLSVICRELNDRRRALGQASITADLVSGNRREILHDFYERSVADLPESMRTFVEDHLLTKSGFRDNLALETALEFPGVTRPLLDTLVARRLLRIEDRLGVQRVELTHDVLAEVIRASRDARQQRAVLAIAARRTRRLRWLVGGLATIIAALCVAGLSGLRSRELEFKRMSRIDVGIASRFLEEGQTADGLAYLLRAASKDPRNPTIPPRLLSVLTSRNFLLPEGAPLQLGSRIFSSQFSDDGKSLLVFCEDGTVAVVNLADGTVTRNKLPSPPRSQGGVATTLTLVGCLCQDGVVRVLDRASGQLVREIRFDKKGQIALGATADNRTLFVRLEDESVGLAEIESGRTKVLPLKNSGLGRGISETGRWFAHSEEPRNELHVWDAVAGVRHKVLSLGYVVNFAFSPDEKQMLTLSRGESNSQILRAWSLPGCEPIGEPQVVENGVGIQPNGAVRFSDDGRLFIVGHTAGAQVYETATRTKVGPYVAGAGTGARFTPDGRRFLLLSPAGLEWRDVATGKPTGLPMQYRGNIRLITFSQDGRVMLTATGDGFARLWDVDTGELIAEPTLQQSIDLDAALSPDGTQLVIGTVGGAVYRLRVGRGVAQPLWQPRTLPALPLPFAPSAPSRLLWLGGTRARMFDAASGREVAGGFTYPEPIAGFDGQRRGFEMRADHGAMVVRNPARQAQAWLLGPDGVRQKVVLESAPVGAGSIRFSAAGDLVAIVNATENRTVHIWDLLTGKAVGAPLAYDSPIQTGNTIPFGFSPDGKHFAAGAGNGVAKVWDVVTGRALFQLAPMRDTAIGKVEFSPDGTRIVTGNNWGEVQLWDAATGRSTGPLIYHAGNISCATFSPDGRYLLTASTDGTARVWDCHTAAPVSELVNNGGSIRSAAFSPDGERFVTVSQGNQAARIWDSRTGQPLTEPMRHPGRLFEANFSPDGKYLLVELASAPGGYTLWSVPPHSGDAPVPQWLLDLAMLCASKTVDADGQFVDASAAVAKIDDIRRTLAALPADAPYAEWGRWFLADRATRSISPGFTVTPAEAEKLAKEMAAATGPAATPVPGTPPAN